jgi:xanthine dehydrogenase small subunit
MSTLCRDSVSFYLNGEFVTVRGEDAFLNLSDFLRRRRHLPGTKVVCAEGDCGACSVLRAFPKPGSSALPRFEVLNSCIARVLQLDGSVLLTIEGLEKEGQLNPLQEAMITCNASQCGFCTPGIVMALADHFESENAVLGKQDIKNALTGNLCRCTGYQAILDAASQVTRPQNAQLRARYLTEDVLTRLKSLHSNSVFIKGGSETFFAPCDLEALLSYRQQHLDATLLAAGTDLGVQRNKHHRKTPKILSLHLLSELYKIDRSGQKIRVGARVTLSELRRFLKGESEVARFLNIFASPQIKNFATLVGNVANASPIADMPPFLMTLDGEVEVWSASDRQKKTLRIEDLFVSYKKLNLQPGDIIWSVSFRLPNVGERLMIRKISQRRDLDISTVNAAFFKSEGEFRLALGGVAAVPLRLRKTEALLKGALLNEALVDRALESAQEEINPVSDLRGSAAHRRLLVRNLLRDFLRAEVAEVSNARP